MKYVFTLLTTLLLVSTTGQSTADQAKPNIIIVMPDDAGYGDYRCFGNPVMRTPSVDAFKQESLLFTKFHVSPTCAPTRAALMSGRHEFKNGVTHTIYERERMSLDTFTLPQMLKSTGYTTGIFGKWHLGDEEEYRPESRGFDEVYTHGGGGIGQTYPGSCGDAPGNTNIDPALWHNGKWVKTKGYCTDLFFDQAIRWMDAKRREDQPFFAYISLNAAHSPYVLPKKYYEHYLGQPGVNDTVAKFFGMIENIDTNFGVLLKQLDAWKIADDTIVIFLASDNGGTKGIHIHNAGMRGSKGRPYEGGTRVPCFVRWPKGGVPAGSECNALSSGMDIYPTLAAIAGARLSAEARQQVEGRNLLSLLKDPRSEWPYRTLVHHVGRWDKGKVADWKYTACAIEDSRFRLVNNKELYDLEAEPRERPREYYNVISEHPEVVARLRSEYDRWWNEIQPFLVNENAFGPEINPMKALYWEQFGGGPDKNLRWKMKPDRLINGKTAKVSKAPPKITKAATRPAKTRPPEIAKTKTAEEKKPETKAQRDARMAWWHEAKFGMFIHWGIYSVVGGQYRGQDLPGSAEWMMARGKIPIAEYRKYADRFNPTKFDARAFVKMAKDAGMKYLVITAKHHDGFAMFDSVWGDYDVVDATPFGRDVMKELAQACNEAGLRFGFYYSQAQDWHHPGGFGNNWDKSIKRVSSDVYANEKIIPEVRQLLTEYGPISILWWDTPRNMSPDAFAGMYSLSSLQPGIITNDRLGKDYPGDHKTFERHIPDRGPVGKPWEVCMPISGSWGYKKSDNKFKSTRSLIRNLADVASKGGNYLLNVSPTGEGVVLPQATERLQQIGEWMKVNGDSIYGTTGSPFKALAWGRCTKKEDAQGTTLYLHVFDWPGNGRLVVPGLRNPIQQAYLMSGWKPLQARQNETGTIISIPDQAPDARNSVIVVQVSGRVRAEDTGIRQNQDGSVLLLAEEAYIHNNEGSPDAQLKDRGDDPFNIGSWLDKHATVEWDFKVTQPGTFTVVAEIALEKDSALGFSVGGQVITANFKPTGGYGKYVKQSVGTVSIDFAGNYNLRLIPDDRKWQPINLRRLELKKK